MSSTQSALNTPPKSPPRRWSISSSRSLSFRCPTSIAPRLLRGAGVAARRRFRRSTMASASFSSRRPARGARSNSARRSRRPRLARPRASTWSSPTSRRRARSSSPAVPGSARCSPRRRSSVAADERSSPRARADHTYRSFATFSDPDGNSWLLQEIKTRLPGRGLSNLDVATLTAFLREAEARHGDVRTDCSEASLVGVVRRLHRRAPAGEDRGAGSCRRRGSH